MDLAKSGSNHTQTDKIDTVDSFAAIGYTPIGAVKSGFGSIEVHAREILLPSTNTMQHFVRMELLPNDEYAQASIANVQSKNFDQFIANLEKLEQTNIDQERFKFTEVQFELDDVKITVFNNDRNDLMWACEILGQSVHFHSLEEVTNLRMLVEKSRAYLAERHV